MTVSFDVVTLRGSADSAALPDATAVYRFITNRLAEGKRCCLVVLVPQGCSSYEYVSAMNNAEGIITLCVKAKWSVSFGLA